MLDLATQRIAVTGGAGFLGQAVCAALRDRGATDVFVPRKRDFDLTVEDQVARFYEAARPDVVIHLAAEVGGIGANMAHPGRFFFANMAMGMHLVEHGRRRGIRKFVHTGTVCAYPKFCPVPFREDDLWNGYPEETNAPYGVAKKALLVGAQSYREQYGLNSIMLLPVNLYGPRDNFDLQSSHVIPALIRKMVEAQQRGEASVTLWGDGTPTREFLYVEDCARGLFMAGRDYNGAEPVNLGTGIEITIKDLAETVAAATGFDGKIIWDTTKPNGQPRRQLDVTRARERFGFEAEVSFADGMARTVEWFRANGA
jgi:GDP-L-fucose synthase